MEHFRNHLFQLMKHGTNTLHVAFTFVFNVIHTIWNVTYAIWSVSDLHLLYYIYHWVQVELTGREFVTATPTYEYHIYKNKEFPAGMSIWSPFGQGRSTPSAASSSQGTVLKVSIWQVLHGMASPRLHSGGSRFPVRCWWCLPNRGGPVPLVQELEDPGWG